MDLEVASHCVGPLSRDYLSKLPHHVLPCMNLQRLFPFEENQNVVSESFLKRVPWRSSVPAPVTSLPSTTFEALNGIDTTTTLIRDKIRWQIKKNKILNAVKKDKKNISQKALKRADDVEAETVAEVPQGVAILAEHLDRDPDPQFGGVYNWYYTGGTLASVAINEKDYLLHSSLSKLVCSKFNENEHRLELLHTLDLERKTPIQQIVTSAAGAVARQRSCVTLFATDESEDKPCLKKIHSLSDTRDPFLGVALQNNSNNFYCTLSSNGTLKLWDVEYSKNYKMKMKVGPGEGITVMDSWSMIQFVDDRTLLLADRCCIHLLDTRMDMREKQLAWCPRNLCEQCEQLSYVTRSQQQDHVVYTTTTHQALSLDVRIGFGQRWSHMMLSTPYVGFTHAFDELECLCLGSQIMSDCVIVVNKWSGENCQAEYRPSLLPSPSRGLLLSRQQGLCLDPTLTQRCSQSQIGLTFLPSARGLNIVRQSATGDIFIQRLSNTDDSENSDQLNDQQLIAFSDWGRSGTTPPWETATVTVTDLKNFTPMLEAITVNGVAVLTDTLPVEEPSKSDYDEDEAGGGWRRSKQYLEDCVDLLAPRLLSVWEVEDEEEWQEADETLVEQDPAEKVTNWLQGGNITLNDHTLADMTSLKPKVTSTPHVMPSMDVESSESAEELPPWQTLPQTPVRPRTPLTPPVPSPPGSPLSSDSDKPPRKRQRLFKNDSTPPEQAIAATKKPPTSTAKKKFIPGF